MADDARDRFRGKGPKRGVGALKGYGQASPLSEAVSGFVGAPRRFSVMDPQAAAVLRQAGIPGIKYLDQASRDAKQGTRNFVVFPGEEDALKILDVYAKGGAVRMQEGGPLSQFMGKTPKRGVSSLPGYGQGADEPAAQVALGARRNIGEFGRALVGAKPYDETNPTGTYRTVQALLNMPTPAAIIPEAGQAVGKAAGALSGLGALGVIKPKGGNWLAGSIDRGLWPLRTRVNYLEPAEHLRNLEGGLAQNIEEGIPVDMGIVERERARLAPDIAINNWIDTKLNKYVRNEMGTPEDPVRALAERGVLHRAPYQVANPNSEIMRKRLGAGMPVKPMGQSQEAQFWEAVTDRAIDPSSAGSYKYGSLDESILQNNPWLEKVPDEAMVYSAKGLQRDLGFEHLIDELRNATNPESGLPRSLQLSPDKLQKVTVPQAVELVDKINKWRAEQKVAADLRRSQNAATVEHKAYETIPGTTTPNERGLRWVELTKPKSKLPDDFDTWSKQEQENFLALPDPKSKKALEEALKYEGETMGHCVDDYCPDVESGRSRIYSLRDAKGEPHVTIEVEPNQDPMSVNRGVNIPSIVQIKGKANRAPKDEYLPFVQDFVRSQNWSKVRDLSNAQMVNIDETSDLAKNMRAAGTEPPKFVTQQELTELLRKYRDPTKGYKKGGAVKPRTSRLRVPISQDRDVMLLELVRAK